MVPVVVIAQALTDQEALVSGRRKKKKIIHEKYCKARMGPVVDSAQVLSDQEAHVLFREIGNGAIANFKNKKTGEGEDTK